eukprot:595270-Pyramimonas_sp.AAC.1
MRRKALLGRAASSSRAPRGCMSGSRGRNTGLPVLPASAPCQLSTSRPGKSARRPLRLTPASAQPDPELRPDGCPPL